LQASIDSSDIAGAGVAAVTVANPPDSGGLSAPSTFFVGTGGGANFAVIAINQAAQDIVYDPVNAVFYLSVTGTAAAHPNTISVLDPATATITSSQAAGSNPNVLAISDDSQFLYAGIDGAASVQRFTLPALHTDISYPLGAAPSGSTFFALDLQVAPGMPHTTAVSLGATGSPSAQGGITIFDDATSRPTKAPGFNNGGGLYASIQWSSDATALFAGNNEDSGFDFYTLAVNSSGVSLSQDFQADFNSFSNNIHFDAGTKFVYADDGHAINPASGLPIGNFNTNTLGAGVIVPDSNLNTAFFISAGAGSTATIQSFDLTHFTPIASITIPNVTNGPIRLIRWAQNGLAFITGGAGVGQVFLVGGSFISPAPPFALTPPPAPAPLPTPAANAPVITKLNPGSAIQGGPAFTLTVTGANFIASSTLQWHGAALATTFDSSTQLHATVASANISTPGTVSVTVANPPASGGLSAPSTFFVGPTGGTSSLGATFAMVTVSQASKDLAYDPLHREIFLSVPEGTAPGNTISVLDLATATIVGAQFAGSNPDLLAMSGDSQFLYAALDGSSSVQRFALPSLDLDINYSLGTAGFFGPQFALDLGVAPGAPHTTAVTLGIFSASPNAQGGLKVFDDATVRPTSTNIEDLDHLAWGADATTLFSTGQLSSDLFVLSAISSGVAVSHDFAVGIGNTRLHFDAGTKLVYSDTGRAVDPSVGTQVGTFNTSGLMVPDSTLNKAFFLISTFGSPTVTINSFDLTTFTQIDSIIINNVTGTPQRLIRWGQNGLAFNTDGGQIFLLGGNFVH
jgi:hypothetical protein